VRKPRDYIGQGHETIGSDILAILAAIPLPEQVLGAAVTAKLRAVQPQGWYPIALLLEAMELVHTRIGRSGLLQTGRKLFQGSHAEEFKKVAHSAADLVYGIDGLYHAANRGGSIGGWKVESFHPGRAVLIKTTPHHCVMEEGILSEALQTLGIPATVVQEDCLRESAADHCRYVLTSPVTDAHWMGGRPVAG
jgi:hypothetical protein